MTLLGLQLTVVEVRIQQWGKMSNFRGEGERDLASFGSLTSPYFDTGFSSSLMDSRANTFTAATPKGLGTHMLGWRFTCAAIVGAPHPLDTSAPRRSPANHRIDYCEELEIEN